MIPMRRPAKRVRILYQFCYVWPDVYQVLPDLVRMWWGLGQITSSAKFGARKYTELSLELGTPNSVQSVGSGGREAVWQIAPRDAQDPSASAKIGANQHAMLRFDMDDALHRRLLGWVGRSFRRPG